MGLLLVMLTFLPLLRFISGVLQWFVMIFEAVLAMPLTALSLLSGSGDGFATQQFSTNMYLLMGVVLRAALMAIGMALSLVAFNTIMFITNKLFAPSLQTMDLTSDDSYLSLGIYVMTYASLAYTLANSAFKMIDLMPNWVMGWIGARIETRVDDVSVIQGQVAQYTSTLAYSSRANTQPPADNTRDQKPAPAPAAPVTATNPGGIKT